jgi:protein-S-isoprenylcysteine O-methyltransferase Ste14
MRIVYHNVFSVLWLAWLIYWWIASSGTKRTVRLESVGSRLAHVLPLVFAALLLALPGLGVPPLEERFIPWAPAIFWSGAALTAAGLLFSVWARVHLGRNWSGTVTVKEEHSLVTTGPYALVRHPIYTGILTGFAGSALALGQWRGLLGLAIATVGLWRKWRLEERWMQETFSETYTAYRKRVRAIIPFVI